jgi:hypothetical protein
VAGIWLSVERMLRGLQLPVSFTRYDDVAACGASCNKHEQGALPHYSTLNVRAILRAIQSHPATHPTPNKMRAAHRRSVAAADAARLEHGGVVAQDGRRAWYLTRVDARTGPTWPIAIHLATPPRHLRCTPPNPKARAPTVSHPHR